MTKLEIDKPEHLRPALQSLGVGVALVDCETWSIVFENAKFFQWFPPPGEGDESLPQRLPELPADRALERLGQGRPYSFECETRAGARQIPVQIELKALEDSGAANVIVECRDLSKQKQAEYMLESYSKMAEKHARDLQREKERVEKLLLNIMPKSVYEEMKDYGTATPQLFDCASVMMLDFVGFTDMAVSRDPSALITELNDMFSAFDRIVELFGCERIKTIGDAYLAVSGLPEINTDHAQNIAKVALRIQRYLRRRNSAHSEQWLARIGINSGPVIGSLVGVSKYVYDIFGPGVNLAARMERQSDPMTITLCEETYELIKDDFVFSDLGEAEIRGFGKKRLYRLESEHLRR